MICTDRDLIEAGLSQNHAALAEHKRRQSEIDRRAGRDTTWDRIEAGGDERNNERNRSALPFFPYKLVPPTVSPVSFIDGWPTPTGTPWPDLPQTPMPGS